MDAKWHHILVTVAEGDVRFYLDSQLKGTKYATFFLSSDIFSSFLSKIWICYINVNKNITANWHLYMIYTYKWFKKRTQYFFIFKGLLDHSPWLTQMECCWWEPRPRVQRGSLDTSRMLGSTPLGFRTGRFTLFTCKPRYLLH